MDITKNVLSPGELVTLIMLNTYGDVGTGAATVATVLDFLSIVEPHDLARIMELMPKVKVEYGLVPPR